MRNLRVSYTPAKSLTTTLEDNIPIPTPSPTSILIKVAFAGCNTKDYKHPLPALYNNDINQGDDCAGTIAALGSAVRGFAVGERVAGFHRMDEPHGSYADYCVCPATTVFRIPDGVAFEEAATIPLATFTAAVALWRDLQIPAPWERSDVPGGENVALVINGAGTAVGSYAVKLAKMSPRVSPLVVTAGASAGYVRSLGADAVLDYRSPNLVAELRGALGGRPVAHVLDASNSLASIECLTQVMQRGARYVCTSKLYANAALGVDGAMEEALRAVGARYETAFVGDVHAQPFRMGALSWPVKEGGVLFGALVSRAFEVWLAEGRLRGHPFRVVQGGLVGVGEALKEMMEGRRRDNAKFVVKVEGN